MNLLNYCLCTAIVFLLVPMGHSADLEDWSRWRGQDGIGGWQAPVFPSDWPKNSTHQVWRQKIGPGYSGIAVADDRVYTMDRNAESGQERILCFSAQDGTPLWQHSYEAEYADLDYGKGPRATPLIADEFVYTLGAVGHVYCLKAESGELIWRKQVIRDFGARQPTWGFAASPIIHGNQLILHIGAEDGCFIALDPATGDLLWRGGQDPCGYATPLIIQHQNRDTLIGWTPENVLGLDPQSGKLHWKIPYPITYGVSIASPIYHDGLLIVSGYWEGTKAIRLGQQPEDAAIEWEENRWLRGLMAQPLHRDGYMYVLDKHHGVVCCKLATGERLWNDDNRLTPAGRNPHASMVWAGGDGLVMALNSAGALVLARFTPEGYTELGRTTIVGETWAHPAFSGPYVFARDDEQLVCVRLVVDR